MEEKSIRQLIDEFKSVKEEVKKQTAATKESSGKLNEASNIIKGDMAKAIGNLSDSVTAPLKSFASAIPGLNTMGKALSAMTKTSGARATEEKAEREAQAKRHETLLGSIVEGVLNLNESFMKGLGKLAEGGKMGLGALAAALLAPVITIAAFFKQLSLEVKLLDKLTKGGLSRMFRPITRFFNAIDDIFSKAGTGRFFKGDTLKIFGSMADRIGRFITRIKNIFKPVMDAAKSSAGFMAGFQPIAKFAATIGRTLGKIFLPITVLMGVFDFVTGFMEGYKQEGLIGGIKEGIISVVDGLVGGLIRMITGAFAWILEAIGLDNFAASLTSSVNSSIEGVYEIFRGVVDVILFPFKLIWNMIKGIFGGETDFGGLFAGLGSSISGIFDGLIDVITAPFNMIYGLVQDIFSFVGFELPDFDIAETIKGFVNKAMDFVKEKVAGFFSFLGIGNDAAQEEAEGKAKYAKKQAEMAAKRERIAAEALKNGQITQSEYDSYVAQNAQAQANLDTANAKVEELKNQKTITDYLSEGWTATKEWISGALSFASEGIAGAWTGLTGFVTDKFTAVKDYFTGMFTWASEGLENFSLMDMVRDGFNKISTWVTGLFDIDVSEMIKSVVPDWAMKWLPDSWFGDAKARGGPLKMGIPTLVGEYGPELIVPNQQGVVMNASRTANLLSASSEYDSMGRGVGGGGNVIVNNAPTTVNSSRGQTYMPVGISDSSTAGWNGTTF